jgi:hypothetical protein
VLFISFQYSIEPNRISYFLFDYLFTILNLKFYAIIGAGVVGIFLDGSFFLKKLEYIIIAALFLISLRNLFFGSASINFRYYIFLFISISCQLFALWSYYADNEFNMIPGYQGRYFLPAILVYICLKLSLNRKYLDQLPSDRILFALIAISYIFSLSDLFNKFY